MSSFQILIPEQEQGINSFRPVFLAEQEQKLLQVWMTPKDIFGPLSPWSIRFILSRYSNGESEEVICDFSFPQGLRLSQAVPFRIPMLQTENIINQSEVITLQLKSIESGLFVPEFVLSLFFD